jgi:hypothetical protein
MAVTRWEQYKFEERITEILSDLRYEDPKHHGQPFVTPYQIAIEFVHRYREDFKAIGLPIGGEGTGERNSLAQYIALQLSQRIKAGTIQNMETAFLHTRHLQSMTFKNEGGSINASSPGTQYDISIFRLIS